MNFFLTQKAAEATVPAEVIQKLGVLAAARALGRGVRVNAAGARTGYRLARNAGRHGQEFLGAEASRRMVRGTVRHTQARMLAEALGRRGDRIARQGGTAGLVTGVVSGFVQNRAQRVASRAVTRLRGRGRELRIRDRIDRLRDDTMPYRPAGFVPGHYRNQGGRRIWVRGYYG